LIISRFLDHQGPKLIHKYIIAPSNIWLLFNQ